MRRRLWVGFGCFAATIGLIAVSHISGFFDIYGTFSRKILGLLAAITSVFPFPVWEIAVVGLSFWALISLVLAIRNKRFLRWLAGVWMGVGLGVFLFVGLWGLNHFGPKINEKMNFPVEENSIDVLKSATYHYFSVANDLAQKVPRNSDGSLALDDFSMLAKQAGNGYHVLAQQYNCFTGSTAAVKRLISSDLFGKFGITGIFVDFTGESCISSATFSCSLPFTMCHEIGHRMGFAAENEANFAAFLACDANESIVFRYSGYYDAFIYCYNALYKVDAKAAGSIWKNACTQLLQDCRAESEHYEAVVSEAAEKVSNAVNDTYLKAFSESSGVQSYGEVADLLIAWYAQTNK